MAVAVPRRSDLQTAPGPSRTAPPPEPKKRPRDRPRPGGQGRSAAAAPTALRKEAAPKRKSAGRKSAGRKGAAVRTADAPARKSATPRKATSARASATATPARKAAPRRKKAAGGRASAAAAPARKPRKVSTAAPARKAPARRKAAPKRRLGTGARVIPIAAGTAGRAAVAVTQLPESGLIHRLTRGRAWIGVLGVLLTGIVALNVVTLSFAASSGKVEAKNLALSQENSMLQGLQAEKYGQERMRHLAAEQGLSPTTESEPQLLTARPTDVAEATARLAAAESAQVNPE